MIIILHFTFLSCYAPQQATLIRRRSVQSLIDLHSTIKHSNILTIVLIVRNGNFLLMPTVCPDNTASQHVLRPYTIKVLSRNRRVVEC